MLTDYWAFFYKANPRTAETEIVDEGFDIDVELARINAEAEAKEIEASSMADINNPDDWVTL